MNKEKALYIVGSVSLPNFDAGASRILELSKGFKPYFDRIIISGKHDEEPHKFHNYDEKISFLPYHTIKTKNLFDKLGMIFFPKKSIVNDLNECITKYNVTHILIYSALNIATVKKIKKVAKKHSIKLIYDVVEFQTLSAQTLSSYFSFYLPNMLINKHIIKNGDNVISISSYLNDYFLNKGCNSVCVPFAYKTDEITTKHLRKADNSINLMYAGSPKKGKDLLLNSVKGISLLPEDVKSRVRYNIAGITKEEFLKKNKISKIESNISFLGQISPKQIDELYAQSDFSVLIRNPDNRLSKAGFPTKISESLVYGVPAICNISSDLSSYLTSGENSIIMQNSSAEEFARCVVEVSCRTPSELTDMKNNARRTAETKLDISLFDESIKKILF